MLRTLFKLLLCLTVLALAAAGGAWWWLQQPLQLSAPKVEVAVPNGASLRTAANRAVQSGVKLPPDLLYAYFRLQGREQTIKPGDYEVTRGMTAGDLLDKLIRGDRIVLTVTLVEGWTFRQVRAALARAENLSQDTAEMTGEQIMKALGKPGVAPEGRFFPDTYHYAKNSGDLAVLRLGQRVAELAKGPALDQRHGEHDAVAAQQLVQQVARRHALGDGVVARLDGLLARGQAEIAVQQIGRAASAPRPASAGLAGMRRLVRRGRG